MATKEKDKEDDAVVNVEEDGVVTVDITDSPELAAEPEKKGEPDATDVSKIKEAKKPPARVRLTPEAADEAKTALQAAVKNEETLRKAAEATAASERRRADQATSAAQAAHQDREALRGQVEDRELALVTTSIERAQSDLDSSKADWIRHQEAGDFPKAADAQAKMASAAAALDRLSDAKATYEANRGRVTTEGRVTQQQQDTGNPFERYVSQFPPRAQAWLRAHPNCVPPEAGGDATQNTKMMAGHWAAKSAGQAEGSDDYFKTIDSHISGTPVSVAAVITPAGAGDDEEAETVAPAPKPKAAARALPSAPVTRDPPAANGQRTTRSVTLSKDQQDAAKISFPHLNAQQAFAEYARNLIALEAEGKMGRTSH